MSQHTSWFNRLKEVFSGRLRPTSDTNDTINKYNMRVETLLPLTAEQAARIPTSLLLIDVMWHYSTCRGKCEHCRPKWIEIDIRLPVRDARYMNLEPKEPQL